MPVVCTKENTQTRRSLTTRQTRETAEDQKIMVFRGSRIEGMLIEERQQWDCIYIGLPPASRRRMKGVKISRMGYYRADRKVRILFTVKEYLFSLFSIILLSQVNSVAALCTECIKNFGTVKYYKSQAFQKKMFQIKVVGFKKIYLLILLVFFSLGGDALEISKSSSFFLMELS